MFARSTKNLPEDPTYPKNLTELGYKINEKSQFVQVSTNKFAPFYTTDSERANVVEKEAMNVCARAAVAEELDKHGVVEVYLMGEKGVDIAITKPNAPHVRIFMTDPAVLKEKKDVIIIIGEHTHDPGIWARRLLMGDGGIDGGSAVGLMKKLEDTADEAVAVEYEKGDVHPAMFKEADKQELAGMVKNTKSAEELLEAFQLVDNATELHRQYDAGDDAELLAVAESLVPGVIILNPGQLLYSHELNDCMTQSTWSARPKSSAIGSNYKTYEDHNHVPGHTTPWQHVETMFDHVVPQLVKNDVRLFIVGITDGAEHFIRYMDSQLAANVDAPIGGLVTAMAFMEPTHGTEDIESVAFKIVLHSAGKCWIKSSKPKGTWINAPNAMKPIMSASQLSLPEKKGEAEGEEVTEPVGNDENATTAEGSLAEVDDVHEESEEIVVYLDDDSILNSMYPLMRFPNDDLSVPAVPPPSPALSAVSILSAVPEEAEDDDDDNHAMAGSYDYHNNTVSCPTYSAGVDIDEFIWPEVMDLVLDFFKDKADKEEKLKYGMH